MVAQWFLHPVFQGNREGSLSTLYCYLIKGLVQKRESFPSQYVNLRWLKSLSNHKWLWFSGSNNLERPWPFFLVKCCVTQLLVSCCWYFWRQKDWLNFFLGSSSRRLAVFSWQGLIFRKNIGKLAIYLVNNLCLPACDQFTSQLCISAFWT